MRRIGLDTETFSSVPIAHGTHAYVAAEDFEIPMFQYGDMDGGPITVLEHPTREQMQAVIDGADEVVVHNSAFDRIALARVGVVLPVEKIHDTMVRALLHSLPAGLDKLCEVLRVPQDQAKQKSGKRLIHLFTKPQPANRKVRRATKATHPVEWEEFRSYAASDIEALRAIYPRIPFWNWKPQEIELWRLDQVVNDRGFAVDLDLARGALRAADRAAKRLAAEAKAMTSGKVPSTTQRNVTLAYVQGLGADIDDLRGGTIEAFLKDPEVGDDIREILENRAQASATSPAKYKTLLRSTSADGRLRGTLQFAGASRTFRKGGRLFQPQNLPRPKLKQHVIDFGVQAMKADCEDVFFDDVMELCASAVRGSIIAPPGKKLVVADLSNIEGRVLAWLAGETWKLDAFRRFDTFILDRDGQKVPDPEKPGEFLRAGPDLYKVTAGGILGKRPEDVTDDERQKQGKVPELACGFQGAVGAFNAMAALYGLALEEERVLEIVRAWRKKHKQTVKLWYGLEDAAIAAIENPGQVYRVGKLAFMYDKAWLRLRKPNGIYLNYPQAEVSGGVHECHKCDGKGFTQAWAISGQPGPHPKVTCVVCRGTGELDLGPKKLSYTGVDQYTRQWKRIPTYGGKLAENPTQSVARDVFYAWAKVAEEAGYAIVTEVHDELVCEVPDTDEYSAEGLVALLEKSRPGWTEGLPLAAAGHECYSYRKG